MGEACGALPRCCSTVAWRRFQHRLGPTMATAKRLVAGALVLEAPLRGAGLLRRRAGALHSMPGQGVHRRMVEVSISVTMLSTVRGRRSFLTFARQVHACNRSCMNSHFWVRAGPRGTLPFFMCAFRLCLF